MFVSHQYQTPKPGGIVPSLFYDQHKKLSAHIVVFDILIGNSDRHAGNIMLGLTKPEQPFLIDHERSLLGVFKRFGCRRLKEIKNRLGLSVGIASTKDNHCLIQHLSVYEDIVDGINRIFKIPDYFIDDITSNHKFLELTKTEARDLRDF